MRTRRTERGREAKTWFGVTDVLIHRYIRAPAKNGQFKKKKCINATGFPVMSFALLVMVMGSVMISNMEIDRKTTYYMYHMSLMPTRYIHDDPSLMYVPHACRYLHICIVPYPGAYSIPYGGKWRRISPILLFFFFFQKLPDYI